MPFGIDGIRYVERHSAFNDAEHCRYIDDDFRGHSIDTLSTWRVQNTGGRGNHAIVDGMANGILRMTTGDQIADRMILDMNNVRQVDPSLQPVLLVRGSPTAIINHKIRIGLVDVLNTDHCIFLVNFALWGNSIWAQAYSAGAQTHINNTGIILDGNQHYFGIYIDANGKPYWYIDGVLRVTGDNADLDPTEFFQPYVDYETEDAQFRPIDIDFVKGWQRRA